MKKAASMARRRARLGDTRLAVNIPVPTHRALKVRAAERGMTIRAYLLLMLREHGIE